VRGSDTARVQPAFEVGENRFQTVLVRVTTVESAIHTGRCQCPAVGHPAQAPGQAFDVIGDRVRRLELGDALDESITFDLNSAGGPDGSAVRTGEQDARVVDVICPRTDRAEIRKDIPDFLHASRDRAGALNVGHLLKLRER
jgi:hypothetical protein